MFVDDTNLFLSHKNINTLFSSINVKPGNVANKFYLNVDKTKWLLFHSVSKTQSLPQTLPKVLIKNINIKREHVAKFLGVFIGENWEQHIHIVSNKIIKA